MSSAAFELKDLILKAGAGAGKTTRLTREFIEYAQGFEQKNKRYPNIVVTTFTRKATQELKERLLKRALELEDERLFQYVSTKSKVQISTIHGVLSLFLSRYGSYAGLTPDFKILSDSEIRKLSRKVLKNHLFNKQEYLELLENYEFSVLEEMILKYFSEGQFHSELRPVNAEELKKIAQNRLGNITGPMIRVLTEIDLQTDKENWKTYIQHLLSLVSKIKNPEYTDEDWDLVCSQWTAIRKPVLGKTPAFDPSLHDEFDELNTTIKEAFKKNGFLPSSWQEHFQTVTLFKELADAFSIDFMKMKLEQGFLAMSDLESLAFKISSDFPEAAEKFSKEWDYWMIDEYQDTSPVQVNLLQRLIGDSPVFIVGDPQQSIYLFRGARSEVFAEKVNDVHADQGVVEQSLVNYRSSPEVLEFFNLYFTRLSSEFSKMVPDPSKEKKTDGAPVVHILKSTKNEELDAPSEYYTTIARIQELLNEGVSPEKICVLGRTHKVLSELSILAQKFGLSVQLHSGSSYYERREILDALSLLKFYINPHDNENLVSLLRAPWLCLVDSEILKITQKNNWSFWETALNLYKDVDENHPISFLKEHLKLTESLGYTWVFKKSLIDLGFIDFAAGIDSTGRREANLWKFIAILSAEEKRPGFNFLDFLNESMQELSADEMSGDSDATPVIEPKRVNFMTVHASKGLQFDHIILPAMGQRPITSRASNFLVQEKTGLWTLKIKDDETQSYSESLLATEIVDEIKLREAQEYNRVLYVALTRAKFGVTLIWTVDSVDKSSWAAKFPLEDSEGLHQEENFSYLVRNENLEPVISERQKLEIKDVRSKWISKDSEKMIHNLSITEILEKNKVTQGNWAQVQSQQSVSLGLARAQQGTDAHRLFEALKYSDVETVLELSDENMQEGIKYIVDGSESPLMSVIEFGHVEWGFALKYQNCLFQGQIDLWGIVGDTLWVVDYKTGSQKYSEMAFEQLAFYVWVLSKMKYVGSNLKIKLAVVYPMDKVTKIKEVSDIQQLIQGTEKMIQNYFL